MHYPDHPSAIVGLSNILLDIYCEVLPPPPAIPSISPLAGEEQSTSKSRTDSQEHPLLALPLTPLGLRGDKVDKGASTLPTQSAHEHKKHSVISDLPPAHKATSLPLIDRLAARDRAYGLLSGLSTLR